jgi:predicted membrane chloride channel (bestrophin family)
LLPQLLCKILLLFCINHVIIFIDKDNKSINSPIIEVQLVGIIVKLFLPIIKNNFNKNNIIIFIDKDNKSPYPHSIEV